MNKDSKFNEQRRFSRISFDADVQLVDAKGSWRSQLIDLSLKGALIAAPRDWSGQPGEHFLLELALDSSEEVVIRMEVSVSHLENDHIGFRCEHIDLDSISHLRRLVELNLGDAELLDRELSALGRAEV
ncbi:MAG TPA: PilZ domain-containing protein [Chromatiales bacterium]|nr:PilZ domain-containing protein [Chromatiales bacterium]HEX22470.1 PilZ domain-containing protein [Chromatiales bacterium]